MSLIYGFYTGSHSPAVALMKDGKIISCLEEERIRRVKSGDNYDINVELSSEAIQKFTGVNIIDADYNVFASPTPKEFARKITNNRYEKIGHHTAHAYGAYFTSGFEEKTITITYDGGGEYTVMKMYLCENGKMTLVKSEPFAFFGSL